MKKVPTSRNQNGFVNNSTSLPKGNVFRVKMGYNPNSSSIGSMLFAVPVTILGVAVGFGAISGIIFSAFSKKNGTATTEDGTATDNTTEPNDSMKE